MSFIYFLIELIILIPYFQNLFTHLIQNLKYFQVGKEVYYPDCPPEFQRDNGFSGWKQDIMESSGCLLINMAGLALQLPTQSQSHLRLTSLKTICWSPMYSNRMSIQKGHFLSHLLLLPNFAHVPDGHILSILESTCLKVWILEDLFQLLDLRGFRSFT